MAAVIADVIASQICSRSQFLSSMSSEYRIAHPFSRAAAGMSESSMNLNQARRTRTGFLTSGCPSVDRKGA